MEHDFFGRSSGNFREERTSEKVVLFFPDGIFQTEICVSFIKSHR